MDLEKYRKAIEAVVYKKDEEAIKLFSELLNGTKDMDGTTMITILVQRSECYFRKGKSKDALIDLKKAVEMGYPIRENEELVLMYHQLNIEVAIDEAADELHQVALIYPYSFTAHINQLQKLSTILTLRERPFRYRKRSQSADQKRSRN